MNFLFVHQNFPGQYPHLAAALAADPMHRVLAIGEQKNVAARAQPRGVRVLGYPTLKSGGQATHPFVRNHEATVRRGHLVAKVMQTVRDKGFVPDVVCGHPAWGEMLFARDVFPDSRLIGYSEFYYRARGSDVAFDPEFPSGFDDACRVRVKNATLLLSLDTMDLAVAPTQWQKDQVPAAYASRVHVVHDGIDTDAARPDPSATLKLADGTTLTPDNEVVTYVARNLEPYRGFHVFMRTLPEILVRRPHARVVILGGDEVSYGVRNPAGRSYRESLLEEVEGKLDTSRVHFLGRVPYRTYLSVLQVSTVHVYLTYPFVLSWSLLEAMAAGCMVVGSRTAPVEEVVEDGRNGWLTDFFDRGGLADRVCAALEGRAGLAEVRAAARRSVVERYDLEHVCLPRQLALLTAGGLQ